MLCCEIVTLLGNSPVIFLIMPSTFGYSGLTNARAIAFRRDSIISVKYRPDSYFYHNMAFYYYLIVSKLPSYSYPICDIGKLFTTGNESLNAHALQGDNLDLSTLGDNISDPFFLQRTF
jgi:hypothetical protein